MRDDLWADILQDVSTASTSRDKKVLLVLGDQCIGKSTVISRLRGTGDSGAVTKPGIGLEYSFVDIRVSGMLCVLALPVQGLCV